MISRDSYILCTLVLTLTYIESNEGVLVTHDVYAVTRGMHPKLESIVGSNEEIMN